MNTECIKKCENKNCENKTNSSYIKRIIRLIGPVILGSKPSEIVNIPGCIEDKERKLNEIEGFFGNCRKVKYEIIKVHDGSKRVLFINEKSMNRCLSDKKCKNFLKFLGYPKEYNFETYMKELVFRLESEEFPHEIGIFLGYPLKDVLGFMGYGKQEFVEVCSWRIYGDKEVSYKVYNRFVRDKMKMNNLVEKMSISELKNVI
ncbi:DUF3793 family protein [Intestinibacter bartlettii]|uniref:DUF3793 family protein n=1 Tax=Intestinibacter bartlettii TaxID=261299 RepID=A0ABS6DV08_9FIRM|nr:DUF3793 family protein [Intestinibacter bartlettii]MBU5335680.1 DUF3793 family protein [Intestinibacter bartlettii]